MYAFAKSWIRESYWLCLVEQANMIEEIFNLFDTDGEQQLDEDELAAAIFAMGFSQCDHVQVPE